MNYKKKLLALLLVATSLACSNSNFKKTSNNVNNKPTTFNIGNIYIGDQDYLDNLKDIKDNDIIVLDDRFAKDPNIKIMNSYKIMTFEQMDIILNEILEYEEKNPSDWNRSLNSMKHEWFYHNMSYYLNYKTERTRDVDLNNNDEEKYSKILIK